MATRLIVDAQTDTILNIEHCYILTIDDLDDHDQATLLDINEDSGADDDIVVEMAKRCGIKVTDMGDQTGWGDLTYTNAVAYSPKSLRDEANVLIDCEEWMRYDESELAKKALEWVDNKATTKELEELAGDIMQDDNVWNGYRENFVRNLIEWYPKLDGGGNPDTPSL